MCEVSNSNRRYCWRLLSIRRATKAWLRQWHWLVIAAVVGLAAGGNIGYFAARFQVSVELQRQTAPDPALTEKPGQRAERPIDPDSPIRSAPDLLRGLAVHKNLAESSAPVEPIGVSATKERERIVLSFRGRDRLETVRFANRYAAAAAELLSQQESRAAGQQREIWAGRLLVVSNQLTAAGAELAQAISGEASQRSVLGASRTNLQACLDRCEELRVASAALQRRMEAIDAQVADLQKGIAGLNPTLVSARDELNKALLRYTEEHPRVRELRATVSALETEAADARTNALSDVAIWAQSPAATLGVRLLELRNQRIGLEKELAEVRREQQALNTSLQTLPAPQADLTELLSRLERLGQERGQLLASMQKAAPADAETGVRYAVSKPASHETVNEPDQQRQALTLAAVVGTVCLLLTMVTLLFLDLANGRIETEDDLRRVTKLPVLLKLDNLNGMSDAARSQWALRAFARLKRHLTAANEQSLVCGFISAVSGEGRSTVIELLASAARQQGHRVLVISAHPKTSLDLAPAVDSTEQSEPVEAESLTLPVRIDRAIAQSESAVCLRFADGEWNVGRRQQWSLALREAQGLEYLVLLLELPPATSPRAFALAESVPNVVWLCGEEMTRAAETHACLELLEDCRCHLVGCIMNKLASAGTRRRQTAPRAALLLVSAWLALSTTAQEPLPAAGTSNVAPPALSLSLSKQLADWQKRLTLGPGDVLDISLHGQTDTARGMSIGPDGRINYLEARDFLATGLTVDELRSKLEEALGKYRRAPRVIVKPAAYLSKRYCVLGNVNVVGLYALDRPTTLIEAVAKAKGFTRDNQPRVAWLPADFARSFLVRRKADGAFERVAVDFEALFLRGDLHQNLALAPDDYLYFSPLDLQELYVLGEVRTPGLLPYTREQTVLAAIAAKGGFTDRAYKGRVLVVRGSLSHPVPVVVNLNDIMKGRQLDFPLNNRDIVYVNRRPFVKAEEMLEAAITAFAQAFVVGYAGQHVGPFIKEPIVE